MGEPSTKKAPRKPPPDVLVSNALDIAAYVLEQRHKGRPVHVDWIDHPELKALVTKLVVMPDYKASDALDRELGLVSPRGPERAA